MLRTEEVFKLHNHQERLKRHKTDIKAEHSNKSEDFIEHRPVKSEFYEEMSEGVSQERFVSVEGKNSSKNIGMKGNFQIEKEDLKQKQEDEEFSFLSQYEVDHFIPCMVISNGNLFRNKVFLHFHANAEDIFVTQENCETISRDLDVALSHPVSGYFDGVPELQHLPRLTH